ncbi:MAG TPA: PD-(D/E)XK nuclease family protein, partial [Pyrinomonadaceae bacterium]|nr:PD-(D/E)XK nuclease family protein [Pyrinomonadaceae bacterium]
AKLADRAAVFRVAIDSMQNPENAVYVGLPLLLLDVTIKSRLETELISKLAAGSANVLATAPHGDERAITFLEESLGCKRKIHESITAEASSLSCAKRHLFEDSIPTPKPLDQSVHLQSWPGEPRECMEIVRSIQSEAAAGVPFDQMAVLLNSPGEYRSHLEEAFSRAAIPAYFVQGTTAPDPAGRAMLALLSCAAEGLSARAFAEYLSLGQVPDSEAERGIEPPWVGPSDELLTVTENEADAVEQEQGDSSTPAVANPAALPVIEGTLRTPARWERLLVDSAVIGGRERWARRLQGLENELLLRLDVTEADEEIIIKSVRKQLSDLEALRAFALPLIDRLSKLPARASWSEWLAHLRELATNSLRQPDGVLATLADLGPMGAVGPIDLHEVQLVLGPRLHDLRIKPKSRRYGSVFVGPISAARGLSFRVVFVPGLAERMFPRKIVEDPILLDKQRVETDPNGLTTRRDQLELERLALRLAVGAARERIYLSYPRVDVQQSRPRVPSFYALEALRAAEGVLPGFEEIAARAETNVRARLGWPAPEQPAAAIDEAEYDLALLASLVDATDEEVTGRAHYLLTANPHLARALRGRSRRWLLRRWTQNDGLVDVDPLAREAIANHQFSARSFSATALQHFASCPYRFFLSAILRLDLRQEPAPIEAIDPLTRGSLFHETQFEVLTNLKAVGLLPLKEAALSNAFELVDLFLGRLAGEYEDKFAPAIPRVWEDGISSIKSDLREWLRRMANSDDGWVPDKFELSFGLSDRGPRSSDPESIPDPVEIIGDLQLRGSIDLVERHVSGKFRVTDHKTGKARAPKGTVVGGGKYLQPLLYALASKKLLDQPVDAGRLYYCTADGGFEDRVVPLNDESIQTLNPVLIAVRQGLADPFLPAAPEKGGCDWCDYLAVCGSFEETRTRDKPKDRLVELKRIRELR